MPYHTCKSLPKPYSVVIYRNGLNILLEVLFLFCSYVLNPHN
nr:MAG TPA: Neuronal migration protein doublecortin, possible DOMAIN, UBIQUITIN-LIKE FOLD, MICROTUBULE.23A [Caudoviricetes sp.]